jgi:uncharacterized membrane protein
MIYSIGLVALVIYMLVRNDPPFMRPYVLAVLIAFTAIWLGILLLMAVT